MDKRKQTSFSPAFRFELISVQLQPDVLLRVNQRYRNFMAIRNVIGMIYVIKKGAWNPIRLLRCCCFYLILVCGTFAEVLLRQCTHGLTEKKGIPMWYCSSLLLECQVQIGFRDQFECAINFSLPNVVSS